MSNNPYPYPPKTELDSAGYWLHEQQTWVERCGGDAAGYAANYTDKVQAQAVYEADMDALAKAEVRYAEAKDKARKRAPRALPTCYKQPDASYTLCGTRLGHKMVVSSADNLAVTCLKCKRAFNAWVRATRPEVPA